MVSVGSKRVRAPSVVVRPMKRARFGPRKPGHRSYNRQNKLSLRGATARGSVSRQLKSLRRVVKQLEPEIKHVDINCDATDVTVAGAVINLVNIAQGDTIATRTGNSITVKSITVEGIIPRSSTLSLNVNAYYRVVVFRDRQQVQDSNPTLADVFEQPGEPWLTVPDIGFMDRFTILWMSPILENRRLVLDSDDVTSIPTASPVFNAFIPMSQRVHFNGTAGTDIQKNGLYLGYMSNDGNNVVDFDCNARIAFTDV